jgi:hypothetical protein
MHLRARVASLMGQVRPELAELPATLCGRPRYRFLKIVNSTRRTRMAATMSRL